MSLWGDCVTCGNPKQNCICGRVRMMLSDALGSHYRADELMSHIERVATHMAQKQFERLSQGYRIVCTNKMVATKPKRKKV